MDLLWPPGFRIGLSDQSFSHLALQDVPDQTPGSLEKGEFVGKHALQENTHSEMASHIRRGHQHCILGKPEVGQVRGFGQNEEVSRRWRLNFGKLLSEVFNEDVVQAPAELLWFFADDFEAPVQCFQILFCDESPRLQSLLHVWILGGLGDLLKHLGAPLGIVSSVAKERDENFLRIFGWHKNFSPFFVVLLISLNSTRHVGEEELHKGKGLLTLLAQ
jgi:hypothetical protein